ncbi:MAG: TPM domain-containing protein [Spirochaetes bacterium]|nr:TPM domain-containing protein [Spirochaetota bacterium]
MKRAVIAGIITLACTAAQALEMPRLKSRVNDYAGMLSPGTVQSLEARLADLEKTDSTQIVVLTIPSLEGQVLEEFSIKVAEKWKIGQKKKDNGAILLIVKNDRKIRIEVGRGLEEKLTDLVAGRIIRGVITPRFKKGDFEGGVIAGIYSMTAVSRGQFLADPASRQEEPIDYGPLFLVGSFFLVVTIFAGMIGMAMGGKVNKFLAGIPGIISFPLAGLVLHLPFYVIIALAVAGFFPGILFFRAFDWLMSRGKPAAHSYTSGGESMPESGSSSNESSGSSSGGGSPSESYSGGGGSFGGGGASGRW